MTSEDSQTDASSIPQLITAQASAAPDAIALVDRGRKVSYAELEARARRVAGRLTALDVGRNVTVVVALDRSADFVIAALAVLRAGGAYVPLDPAAPSERLAFMLGDADPAAIITDHRGLARLPRDGGRSILIEGDPLDPPETTALEPVPISETDLAYVIYTSGSTGRPKGVEITHHGLRNLVRWHQRAFGVTSADRASQLANPGFDAARPPRRAARWAARHRVFSPLDAHAGVARPAATPSPR